MSDRIAAVPPALGLLRRIRIPAWVHPLAVLLLLAGGLGVVALRLGPDAGYDFLNYHFYIGWALFNKPVGYDIAPAQIQSYLHPGLDGLFYQLWRVTNAHPRLLVFLWAAPQAVAVWLAFLLARELFPAAAGGVSAAAAALIGAGGATSIGVLGTSMSEGVLNALLMGGVLLAVRDRRLGHSPYRVGGAGLLAGAAVGLKLTTLPYLAGFGMAQLLTPGFGRASLRLRRLLALGTGALVGLAAVGGPWWWALYRRFGNPVFPFFNAIFHSPLYGDWNFIDDRFVPRNALDWIIYPARWAFQDSTIVTEQVARDPRIAFMLVAALGLLAARRLARGARRPSYGVAYCAVWAVCSYAVWLKQFSILRYASALEVVSGVIIVAGLRCLLPARAAAAVAVAAATALVPLTVIPTWNRRAGFDTAKFLDVAMPPLASNSLVIYLVATPSSYLAAFEPASVRFVGVNNSLIRLDSNFGLQDRVESAIRDAPADQIWGIDKTDAFGDTAEDSLRRYHLRRTGDCTPILSNVLTHERICRLLRTG